MQSRTAEHSTGRVDAENNSTVQSRTAEYSTGRAEQSREGDWYWIEDKKPPTGVYRITSDLYQTRSRKKFRTKRISR